jgi:hypothetical protein
MVQSIWVDPPQEKIFIYSLTSASRPALGPTQPPLQWVPGAVSPGVKRGRGVMLSTNPHLFRRQDPVAAILLASSTSQAPPWRIAGQLYFTLLFFNSLGMFFRYSVLSRTFETPDPICDITTDCQSARVTFRYGSGAIWIFLGSPTCDVASPSLMDRMISHWQLFIWISDVEAYSLKPAAVTVHASLSRCSKKRQWSQIKKIQRAADKCDCRPVLSRDRQRWAVFRGITESQRH